MTQAPHHLPPCFAGGRLLVYGFLEKPAAADVTLHARGPNGPLAYTLRLDPERVETGALAATLAARTLIRDLEEGMSPLHDRRGSRQDRGGGGTDRVKDEIVRLGVTYGLCSKHTSFVAVERREQPTTGDVQLRRVPIALTSGWGGEGQTSATGSFGAAASAIPLGSSATVFAPRAAAPPPRPSPAPSRAYAPPPPPLADAEIEEELSMELGMAEEEPAPLMEMEVDAPSQSLRPLDRLVALQRADGSWDLTPELADLLGRKFAELEAALRGATGDTAAARRALATTLALRWLATSAADARDEWSLLEKKARRWLLACTARPAGGGEWTAAVS